MQQIKVDKTPLYLQARQYLLSLVEDGTFQPGEQLPSEADLAVQLGISRPTLREALHNLEQEGLIVRRHGVGTFVSRRTLVLESGLEVLESLESQAHWLGAPGDGGGAGDAAARWG
jgi:GntR family transcriptional regulator